MLQKIDSFIKDNPVLIWGIWLAYAVMFFFARIVYLYHNSVLTTNEVLNFACISVALVLLPLVCWHAIQDKLMWFWRNALLFVIGFLFSSVILLTPIFLNINHASLDDKVNIEIKELLDKKIKSFDPNLFVFYFNPEQLTKAIEKHNKKVEEEIKQKESPIVEENKKTKEIIDTLKNIKG